MEREEKIQAYVHGTLDEIQIAAFEKELSENLELQHEVKEYRHIHESIKRSESDLLKKRLQELHAKEQDLKETIPLEEKSTVRRLRPYILPLAAASILFIALAGRDYFFPLPANNLALYDNYFTNYPNTLQPITRGDTNEDKETMAFVAYESGDFVQATALFKEVLDNKVDPDIKFYYGMSLLNSGKDKKALPVLNELKKDSTLYIPQTYWYAALIELKNGNKNRTKELIDSLQLLNADFKTEAALELEKKLK